MSTVKLELLKEYIDVQGYDDALWLDPEIGNKAYVTEELRRIAWMIEEAKVEEIRNVIEEKKRQLGLY